MSWSNGCSTLQQAEGRLCASGRARLGAAVAFRLRRLAAVVLTLMLACSNAPQKGVSSQKLRNKGGTSPVLPSWDLILSERDLSTYGASIKAEWSKDIDYREGEVTTFGNTVDAAYRHSASKHQFNSRVGDIDINLEVFNEPKYAKLQMEMEMWSDTHRFDVKTPEGASLHNYSVKTPSDTIEANPFRSRIIQMKETIGEQTACSQWEDFAPELRFRTGRVVTTVSVGGFGAEHLCDALVIARMQDGKLRRLLAGNWAFGDSK